MWRSLFLLLYPTSLMGQNHTYACELSQYRILLCVMCLMHLLTMSPHLLRWSRVTVWHQGREKAVWQRKCESHLAAHQTAKKDEGRWGTNLQQSKHFRITESTDVTFAHTGVSYARGFNRVYHNHVNSSDCNGNITVPAPIKIGCY